MINWNLFFLKCRNNFYFFIFVIGSCEVINIEKNFEKVEKKDELLN